MREPGDLPGTTIDADAGDGPRHGVSSPTATARDARPRPARPPKPLSDDALAGLRRTADAMKRTTNIGGYADIVDGAVAADPEAAMREIGELRRMLGDPLLETQLDRQLHDALAKRAAARPLGPAAAASATIERGGETDGSVVQHDHRTRPSTVDGKPPTANAAPTPGQKRAPLDDWTVRDPHRDTRYAVDGEGALLRDVDGKPVEVAPHPGDPSPTPDDVTASARAIDMLGTLRATERLRGEQAQRALAEADARYGEGSALSTAVKAYVRERTSALGANPRTVKAALDHANALARDPKTHAGMRANRTAFDRLTPDQKAAAKATRFEIERERRALMDPAIEAYEALGRTSRGEIARGHGPGNPAPGRQRAFDDKIDALAARIPDLVAREDDLPGVPHPDLDPGLARELGQDAARVLDGRERAVDTALDIGMTVAGAILPGGAAGAGAKGLARAAAIGFDAAGAAKAAQDAADAGLAAEIEKHGLDPTNPDTLRHLPPDARNRIAAKAAIAFAANGGAKAGAAHFLSSVPNNSIAPVDTLQKAVDGSLESGIQRTLEKTISAPLENHIP